MLNQYENESIYRKNNTGRWHTFRKSSNNRRRRNIRCGGILINNDKDSIIIVLNRDSYSRGECKWGLPKGHIKSGESLVDCAKREINEETGINVQIKQNTPKIKVNDTYYYIITVDNDINICPKDKREICQAIWININDISKLNTNRGLKKINTMVSRVLKLVTE